MAFTIRNNLDPNAGTNNWSTAVAASGAKLLAGYTSPRRDPQGNVAQSAASWLNGVTVAQPRYQAGLAGYSSAAAITTMQSVGVARYTQAATAKKANYAAVATILYPLISTGLSQLPTDRSTPAARQARMDAWFAYMSSLKGRV
jgi:hypothetical protein